MNFFPLELEEIVEGRTKLLVPKDRTSKGPSKRTAAFYNDAMIVNRDVAVLVLNAIRSSKDSPMSVLDGLASTGAMGIRLANELEGLTVTLNECNTLGYELIKRNIALNSLDNDKVTAENKDLNVLLHQRRYDYIDIDPYGTPVPYIDDASQALNRKGYLGVTATDKAPLSGVYPKACFRKYLGRPIKTEYSPEIGLRILIGFCVRTAAKHELGVNPLVSFSSQHYFRIYLRTQQGAKRADEALKNIGYVCHDKATRERFCSDSPVPELLNAGPLWIGPLFDERIVTNLKPRPYIHDSVRKMIELWKEEVGAPPLYCTTDELAKLLRISPPPQTELMEKLKAHGHTVQRTHFNPTGLKTNASMKELRELLKT